MFFLLFIWFLRALWLWLDTFVIVVIGSSQWHTDHHRFNPRWWAKSLRITFVHLLCKKCIVHRELWTVCTGFLRASSFHLIPSSNSWPPIPLPLSLGTTHILPWLVVIKTYIRHFSKSQFSMSKIVDQQVQNYGYPLNVAHKYKYQNVYQVQNFPLCRLQPSRQGWPPPFGLELSNLF